ncbi:unnamed protein product [Brassicogethes aeneus]|uniref:Uncharacterized protein n=1 Tax=Brassicogethes aeneus TaxID=1431903 RepID=A0A9P0BEM3_BRAAE|nr:unnamed protein product [Brassicogethes aeneus]
MSIFFTILFRIFPGVTQITSSSLDNLDKTIMEDPPKEEVAIPKIKEPPKREKAPTRPQTAAKKRDDSVKSERLRPKTTGNAVKKPPGRNSSIPLLKKSPSSTKSSMCKIPKTSTTCYRSAVGTNNKHTLEVQFINKRKRLTTLTKELIDKQKPVLDLYENLVQIKAKLNELGKSVQLEEIKVLSVEKKKKLEEKLENEAQKEVQKEGGGGEAVSENMLVEMKTSIEEIPKTLLSICQNLLSRRAIIVELLESVTKSEVTVDDISDKIEALKSEGSELQKSLDMIICEHESRINELVNNWTSLLSDKKTKDDKEDSNIEDLQAQLEKQKKLVEQSNTIIKDLQQKLDEKKHVHDKSVNDLDVVIKGLRDQIRRLEVEIENERKNTMDHKTRNNVNGQTIKLLKTKISELELKSKDVDEKNSELSRRLKNIQDSHKSKECQWVKEKEDLSKTIKHQESILQKLTSDRNQFETRYKYAEKHKGQSEEKMSKEIENLRRELDETTRKLEEVQGEKNTAQEKFHAIEQHMIRMGMDSKREMFEITNSLDWGNDKPKGHMEEKMEELATKVLITQLEDRIKELEQERNAEATPNQSQLSPIQSQTPKVVQKQEIVLSGVDFELMRKNQDIINRYQQLLEESEEKLREKSMEVAKLTTEIRHLKVRQDALEEQNVVCPTVELQTMVEEGRAKLNELMRKSMESEQKIADYEAIIDKQAKQMVEMENLLRYRDNMSGVLKNSRDEIMLEKESLIKYSHDLRSVLIDVTKENKIKDRLIKELQDKINEKERVILKLERECRDLEQNLASTNEKRYKLQETVGCMEKELQATKAHVNQLAEIQTRYDLGVKYSPKPLEQTYLNLQTDPSSNCVCNAKSLLSVSLKKMDFLRARLYHLSSLDISALAQSDSNYTRSTQTFVGKKTSRTFDKVLSLTSRKCRLLQGKFNNVFDDIKENQFDDNNNFANVDFAGFPVLRASIVTADDLYRLN